MTFGSRIGEIARAPTCFLRHHDRRGIRLAFTSAVGVEQVSHTQLRRRLVLATGLPVVVMVVWVGVLLWRSRSWWRPLDGSTTRTKCWPKFTAPRRTRRTGRRSARICTTRERYLRDLAALKADGESGIGIRRPAFWSTVGARWGETPPRARLALRRRLETACIRFDDTAAQAAMTEAAAHFT